MNGTPRGQSDGPATAPQLTMDDTVGTIRLNRPLQHNRIDVADIAILEEQIAAAEIGRAHV